MSKRSQTPAPTNPRPVDVPPDETPWQPTTNAVKQVLESLASLRLTVALFAMAIFIVMAGTLGQVDRDIWEVIRDYFRVDISDDSGILHSFMAFDMEWNIPKPWTKIDLKIFFPPSFCPDNTRPDLSSPTSPARMITSFLMGFGWAGLVWLLPMRDKKLQLGIFGGLGLMLALLTTKFGGFWFPKGWTIGAVMAANLLAAHLIRFKVQSKGTRLWSGVGVIGLGILAIWTVIMSGSNKDGMLKENWLFGAELEWNTIWILFEGVLAVLLAMGVYAYISLWRRSLRQTKEIGHTDAQRSATVTMRRIAGASSLLLAGGLVMLLTSDARLGDAGMRILWQLLKATGASLVLLAGCILVFRKRAGVVVLHSGIALVMLSELLVGVAAVETQMQIVEGRSANYVKDIREVELAVVDPSDPETNHVVVIPKRFLKEGNLIQDEKLPVNIRVDTFFKNSELIELGPRQPNPATHGFGKSIEDVTIPIDSFFRGRVRGEDVPVGVVEVRGSTGTDNASSVDHASAYVTLFEKTEAGENGRELGTLLLSQNFYDPLVDFQELPQTLEVDGKPYQFTLRFKRIYKPYTITLKDASQTNYVGTNTPMDYRSIIDLKDPSRNEDRKDIHIWMNNPLRYGGETFYQSGLARISKDKNMTTLQVVTNDGWMIPYVACMIVAVGMMAHFLVGLTRFLNRDSRTVSAALDGKDDPIHQPLKNYPWLTPVLSIVLVLIFAGYLSSKARLPDPSKEGFDFYKAGQLPVAYEGRVKPLDTLARNTLRIMSNRQTFKEPDGTKQPAMRWLMDVVVANGKAEKHRVIRIDYQPVLDMLKLQPREGHLYSLEEISGNFEELLEQIRLASEAKRQGKVTTYQKKVLELERRIQAYRLVELTFSYPTIDGKDALIELVAAANANQNLEENKGVPPLLYSKATDSWEIHNTISLRYQIAELARQHDAETVSELSRAVVEDFVLPLASYAVKKSRDQVNEAATKRHSTRAETARDLAATAPDENLKKVYEVLAESQPRHTEMELAQRLPKDVVRELAKKEAAAYLFLATGGDRQLLVSMLRQVPQDAESPELAVLGVLVNQAVGSALGETTLMDLKQEFAYLDIFEAYEAGDAEAFNAAVAEVEEQLAADPPHDGREHLVSFERLSFESFFNNAAPFYYLAAIYLIAGLLAAVSWLMCSQPLNRATFWLLCFMLVIHTAALIGRIYISGRPPVTNLYSSAVFIGWGCVLIGLLFEWFYDIGLGNLVAAVVGFLTLGVAHLLTTEVASFRGDSFTVMQAVLDTQFWLATHVTSISMGYAATYVAGFLGAAYIVGGMFTPLLSASRRKDLLRMIYGTLCFAIFFSFVGTVLGGLWADDSWGRFWGWDTKENGALIIVLWNALVLHARWGGIVKDRGLAVLAVAGNICVSWSWFGVNELGIGLHSYGFTEGVLPKLALFCVSQLLLISVGLLPKQYWWSHMVEDEKATA